jgi:hypothetical protein
VIDKVETTVLRFGSIIGNNEEVPAWAIVDEIIM